MKPPHDDGADRQSAHSEGTWLGIAEIRCVLLSLLLLWCVGCQQNDSEDRSVRNTGETKELGVQVIREPSMSRAKFPTGVKRAPTGPESLEYWLLISDDRKGQPSGYDKDTTFQLKTTHFDRCLYVWVNKSPIEVTEKTGLFFRINEWLHPGTNEVSFESNGTQRFYAKVIALRRKDFCAPKWQFEEVVGKTRVAIEDGNSVGSDGDGVLAFSADIEYSPFFDDLLSSDGGSEDNNCEAITRRIENEARVYLDSVLSAIRDRNMDLFQRLTTASWEDRPRWGTAREDFDAAHDGIKDSVINPKWQLTTKVSDFAFMVGQYCVLANSGRNDEDRPLMGNTQLYSLRWQTSDGKVKTPPPIRLVRVNGVWEIW